MTYGKRVSAFILGVATFGASVLVAEIANAQSCPEGCTYHGYSATFTFDGIVTGGCDPWPSDNQGACTIANGPEGWFSSGRSGYGTVSGNTFLWVSNDDNAGHWNAWNTWNVDPTYSEGGNNDSGKCNFNMWVFGEGTGTVGELDAWYYLNGVFTQIGSPVEIGGTNNTWQNRFYTVGLDPYFRDGVNRGSNILVVFGRHPNENGGEFGLAIDDITIDCWHD